MAVFFKVLVLMLILCPLATNSSFEYLKFVQQWPKGFCYFKSSKCARTPPLEFTVHGLWPNNFTMMLKGCPGSAYNLLDWDEFHNRDKKWPDLTKAYPRNAVELRKAQSFWKHEWEEHGRCSESMYNQDAYFQNALDLVLDHDLLSILTKANIHPGTKPDISEVISAIHQYKNTVPELVCDTRLGQTPVLKEIGICLTPDMNQVIDCPSQHLRTGNCGNSKIHFPN